MKKKIGVFFREKRIGKNLSLDDVCRKTGIAVVKISGMERNKIIIEKHELELFCSLYECSVDISDYDCEIKKSDDVLFMFKDSAETINENVFLNME